MQYISDLVKRRNIFISGSAAYFDKWEEKSAFEFSTSLSKKIIRSGHNIVTGFGLGIGSCIISGALEELYNSQDKQLEERLKARPFPQISTGNIPIRELWTQYRKDMLGNVGVSIFIFGNKEENGKKVEANGMIEEFEIAVENGVVPVPIGATGDAALTIWKRVMDDFNNFVNFPELKVLYEQLGDETKSSEELINITLEVIKQLKRW